MVRWVIKLRPTSSHLSSATSVRAVKSSRRKWNALEMEFNKASRITRWVIAMIFYSSLSSAAAVSDRWKQQRPSIALCVCSPKQQKYFSCLRFVFFFTTITKLTSAELPVHAWVCPYVFSLRVIVVTRTEYQRNSRCRSLINFCVKFYRLTFLIRKISLSFVCCGDMSRRMIRRVDLSKQQQP